MLYLRLKTVGGTVNACRPLLVVGASFLRR